MQTTKLTPRCQEYLDLQRLFVAWCVANGHQDEAEKAWGNEPGDLQWHESKLAQEFTASYNKGPFVKVTADMPLAALRAWASTGPVIKVNQDKG